MKLTDLFKVLSNETRLQILLWLKEPEKYFPPQHSSDSYENGVCVSHIQKKAGLTQSTVSQYLSMLERVGLVNAKRAGQWTYYKRNEEKIREIVDLIRKEI
ncbi:ArsR/SmtB family transcription factor [Aneurinibacillus terranovensis]|uniref:ArsR/SmtB family transcription factor n=1 Tax=Aneurinibacillus terranovensis TaxID=278991 RepID=UPI0003FE674F|nr:metalloregulator ArsR/SmtB family transcription factor [Aneurinibacillus terranovensis]